MRLAHFTAARALIAVGLASNAMAQSGGSYDLTWNTMDNGGGTSTGGTYLMRGTVGQSDAGDMSGGTYRLQGGFWRGSCVDDADCDDSNVCTFDQCVSATCTHTPNPYGDVDHNAVVNVFDIFCILDGIAGDFSTCSFEDDDIHPCEGNDVLNLFDAFAVLDAIAGTDSCCGG